MPAAFANQKPAQESAFASCRGVEGLEGFDLPFFLRLKPENLSWKGKN